MRYPLFALSFLTRLGHLSPVLVPSLKIAQTKVFLQNIDSDWSVSIGGICFDAGEDW